MAAQFSQLKQSPIFVIGAARSGTTWVYDIIKTHPLVAGIYESWLFTPQNGIGSIFSEANWPAKRSGLGNFISRERALNYSREFVVQIMSNAIQPEHHYLVEKSPNHIYAIPLIHEVFPDARFVCVLRDGRDVVVSVRAAAKTWMKAWRDSFGHSVQTSALAWKTAIRKARHAAESLGDHYMEIRYEEIHRDPIASYQKIFDFCIIPYDDDILEQIYQATDFNHNYKGGENKFRRGGRVGDWREYFNPIDKYLFKKTAGDMLIELGYEHNMTWK